MSTKWGPSNRKNPLNPNPDGQGHYDQGQWGWDYADCKWVWQFEGARPAPVQRMIDRAFDSLGLDATIIKRWNRPIVVPGQGTMTESQYFLHQPDDICCADTVGFCAYQTGVAEFLLGMWVHHVNGYFPSPANSDHFKLVGIFKPGQRPPLEKLLPGDYFLYVRPFEGDPDARIANGMANNKQGNYADHINMYIGPFVEKADDGTLLTGVPGVKHFINGSLTTIGTSMFVLPLSMDQVIAFEHDRCNATIVVGRFKAIERLYDEMVGPPVVGRPSKDGNAKPDPAADIDLFWAQTAAAKAPYPVGGNLSWHQGVHASAEAGADVLSIAPGEIVAARIAAAKPMPEGDANFVLVRHRLVRSAQSFVDAHTWAELAQDKNKKVPDSTPAFSLSMHLAPVDRYLGPKLDGDDVPPLADAAPPWLRKIWPLPRPHDLVPAGTPMVVLAPDGDGFVALGKSPRLELGSDVSLGAKRDKLRKVSVNGVDHWLIPQGADTHVDAWADRPVTPPAKGNVCFFDEAAGRVVTTRHAVDKNVHYVITDDGTNVGLAIHTVNGVDYAEIDSYTRPGMIKADKKLESAVVEDPSGRDVLRVREKTAQISIYLDTQGEDDHRFFPEPLQVTIDVAQIVDKEAEKARLEDETAGADRSIHTTLTVASTGTTGLKTKSERIWFALKPCVPISAADRQKLEAQLGGADAHGRRAALARLTAGTTRIVATLASADGDTEWTLDGTELSPTDGQTNGLWTALAVKSNALVVDTKTDGKGDHDTTQLVPDAIAGAKLHPLAVQKNKTGPSFALVEIAYGVPVAEADAALKKRADDLDASNKARVALAKRFLAGEVVDLRKELAKENSGLPPPDVLAIGREPLGAVGRLVATPGTPSQASGVHVEVFAGKPLLTPTNTDPSSFAAKSVARIASTPWLAYKDTDASASKLLSGDLARQLAKNLAKMAPTFVVNKGAPPVPPDDDAQHWTPTRDEWIQLCNDNARLMSRVVSVHPSEWTLDWPAAASDDESTHKVQTEPSRDDMTRVHQALAWMDGVAFDADADGIKDTSSLVFHAPTRLVEYLRTGVEVTLTGSSASVADGATVKFIPDGGPQPADAVPMPLGLSHGRYAARLLVSETTKADARMTGTVQVTGLPKPLTFKNVTVVRGATTHLRVVEPWLSPAVEWPRDATGYAVDVKHAAEAFKGPTTWFLADGAAHLADAGYLRMRVKVTAFYNDKRPTLTATVTKGTVVKVVSRGPQSSPPAPSPDAEREVQATTLEFDVVASTKSDTESATVTVTADGDDFAGGANKLEWTFGTRAIKKGDSGHDVARLQLYLSQIMAADGAPCYRASGAREDIADDPNKRAAITIDGDYDEKHEGLRHALWRFCYAFAKTWDASASITTSAGPITAGELAQFAHDHPDAIEHPEKVGRPKKEEKDLVAFVSRTSGLHDSHAEWIVVDAAFVKRVVEAFPKGHAVPHADFTFESVVVAFGKPAADGPDVGAPSVKEKIARPLPLPDQFVRGKLSSKVADGVDPSETVEISVPDKGPFKLSKDGAAGSGSSKIQTTIGEMLRGATFFLVPQAGTTSHADPELVTATATGQRNWVIAKRQALPPRDFTRAWGAGDAGWDAAWMQLWLSQAPHNPKNLAAAQAAAEKEAAKKNQPIVPPPTKGYVPDRTKTTPIDGIWSDAWVKALKDYRNDWNAPWSSEALVKLLSGKT